MARVSPNRRPPCGKRTAEDETIAVGGCGNQKDSAMQGFKIKRNVTLMKDYAPNPDYKPEGVEPYAFAIQNPDYQDGYQYVGAAPGCSPYDSGDPYYYECGATGGEGNGSLPCGYPEPSDIMPCGAGSSSFTDGLGPYHNCYVQTEETKSFDHCKSIGFKNAYAYKTWFGRYSYTSRMWNQPDLFDWGGCGCGWHSYDPSPDTTKYLSISGQAHFSRTTRFWCTNTYGNGTYTCPPDETEWYNCCTSQGALVSTTGDSGDASSTSVIDRYSGNFTVATCTSSSTTYTTIPGGCVTEHCTDPCCSCNGQTNNNCCCCPCTPTVGESTPRPQQDIDNALAGNAAEALSMLAGGGGFWGNNYGNPNGSVMDIGACWQITACNPGECRCTVTGGGASWTITYEIKRSCSTGPCTDPVDEWVLDRKCQVDYAGGTADIWIYSDNQNHYGCETDGGCVPHNGVDHVHFSIGPTSYSCTADWDAYNSRGLWETGDSYVNGQLGSPYTAAQVYDDAVALLAHLPLDRDDLLPWRTDGGVNFGPLVHYDEGKCGGVPYLGYCQPCTSSLRSGTIIGKPGPSGIDHVWNPAHVNECICATNNGFEDCYSIYGKSIGAWNDSIGGGAATEWTNEYQASNLVQGAFASNRLFWIVPSSCNSSGGGRTVQSTLWLGKWAEIIFRKQSFNYARPCGRDRFAVSSSGYCFTGSANGLLDFDESRPVTDINSNEYVWVCGTSDLDGCWKVTKLNDTQFQLQEPRIISASMVPSSSLTDCGTGMMAKLLWQSDRLLPGICGRVHISSVTNTAPITCSLIDDTYCVNGDQLRIVDAQGSRINGTWYVDVIDSRTISLRGSNGISSSAYVPNSGMVYDIWAKDWRWNDIAPKGDYVARTWEFNFRDVGEYNRLLDEHSRLDGVGNNVLNDSDGCQIGCGSPGSCPKPTLPPQPRPNSCYSPEITKVTSETSCLPFSPCSPTVAFFSPNGETFKVSGSSIVNAKNHGFGRVTMDEQYGCQWQGLIKQYMDDPLFEPVPCACAGTYDENTGLTTYSPCGGNPRCSWHEDRRVTNYTRHSSYICPQDQAGDEDLRIPCIKYYAGRDQFEARDEEPFEAPKLASGAKLGCNDTNGNCSQNYCPPPGWNVNVWFELLFNSTTGCRNVGCGCYVNPLNDITQNPEIAWIDYLNKLNCVCGGGRFAENYRNNGVGCEEDWFVPAP